MTISAVHDQIDKEPTERRKELQKAHGNLKGTPFLLHRAHCLVNKICRPAAFARVLDAARTSPTRPHSVPSAEQHARNFNHLDAARISLAKALNDADSSVTSEQAELTRLKEELHELEGGERPGRRGRI